jgi:hypothetical protein
MALDFFCFPGAGEMGLFIVFVSFSGKEKLFA